MSRPGNPKDTASAILARLRQRRVVAYLIVATTILAGGAAVLKSIGEIGTTVAQFIAPYKAPKLLQIAVTNAAYTEETQFPLGVGPESIRTFFPDVYLMGKGLANRPIFQISLENPNAAEMLFTSVRFHISEVGQISLGESGPLKPTQRYSYDLEFKTGVQSLELIPPFRIDKNTIGSFEIELFTSHPGLGLCWIMQLEFVSNHGSAWSDEFQLVLSGAPAWAQ